MTRASAALQKAKSGICGGISLYGLRQKSQWILIESSVWGKIGHEDWYVLLKIQVASIDYI